MKHHPYTELFPYSSAAESKALADDIKAHGQREPITTYKGMILDGRNRYHACILVGIKPQFEEYEGDDPLGFLVSKNANRRHLTISQRALIATELENPGDGGDRQDASLPLPIPRSEAARMMGVGPRLVASAKALKEKAFPDLIEAVRRGEISVFDAEAEIKKARRRLRKTQRIRWRLNRPD